MTSIRIIDYDLDRFPFPEIVRRHLDVPALNELHLIEQHAVFERKNDQGTSFHRRYYEIGEEFYVPYRQLVKEVVRPLFDEPIIYQRIPNLRVQLAENVAVGEFHRDRDYDHSPHEVNFILALTDVWDSNTI